MKAAFKSLGGKLHIEVEGDSETDLFEGIAKAQETFVHEKCGLCGSDNIKFVVRQNSDDDKFYELHCQNFSANKRCGARLPFGQAKKPKGNLYPKRRWGQLSDSEKQQRGPEPRTGYMPHDGWFIWKPVDKQETSV